MTYWSRMTWIRRGPNLRGRYADGSDTRFGVLASSRDKALEAFGIDTRGQKPPGFHGPWYGDPEGSPSGLSCRDLTACETEFGARIFNR